MTDWGSMPLLRSRSRVNVMFSPVFRAFGSTSSSALLGWYELVALGADPAPGRDQVLEFAEDGVESGSCPLAFG
ncbi:hypothetical protein, partial [Kineosporia sp. NBRC 101677]|uniref:hypothetical protein n=1 Tax=Kineosporia sp. NBRC 101677 TaxID=3032197 RepID=UPI002557195B